MWNGKKWAYSITYDEGCSLLLKHVLPLHRKYNIPGHIALVANEVGKKRNIRGSHYNGLNILNKHQIQSLVKEGWGVSCHSLTHRKITNVNARDEMLSSKIKLENLLELNINIFCIPSNNDSFPVVKSHAKKFKYSAVMTIYDNINLINGNLLKLNRIPLHSYYPKPFYSAFDPFKRIIQAKRRNGWIIDYCHCPTPGKPIHPNKDCTLEQLEARFKAIAEFNDNDLWLEEPNKIVKFLE